MQLFSTARASRRTARSVVLAATVMLSMAGPARADLSDRQMALVSANCLQCHARERTGAPLIAQPSDWKKRVAAGEEAMLRHVIEGLRGMPPSGYCGACDETDLRAMIRWMSEGGADK